MKQLIAFIKQHKLSQLTLALHKITGLTGMTIQDVQGFGRWDEHHSREEDLRDFIAHIRLEIFCEDEMADQIIRCIIKETHTGLRGDGKIYVVPVENAFRISTGETGDIAV